MPIVSVIMSVYNGERYLLEAIDSILTQSFRDFELIVVDDGSIDNSPQILKNISDHRLRIITQKNRGLPNSLNVAIAESSGKYIARMDADDICLPNRLQLQYNYMQKHPEIGIIGGQARKIDENGKHIGEMNKPIGSKYITKYIKYVCPVIHPTYFVRRDVYKKLAGYQNITPGQDYDFLYRAFNLGIRIDNIPQIIINYRINTSGNSSSNISRTLYAIKLIQRANEFRCKENRKKLTKNSIIPCNITTSNRFKSLYKKRNMLISNAKNTNFPINFFCILKLVFVCSFNVSLFRDTYNSFIAKLICKFSFKRRNL